MFHCLKTITRPILTKINIPTSKSCDPEKQDTTYSILIHHQIPIAMKLVSLNTTCEAVYLQGEPFRGLP